MNDKFFPELARRLKREGIATGQVEKDHLPVLLEGREVMSVAPGGTIFLRHETANDQPVISTYDVVAGISAQVCEYTEAMAAAPRLEAAGLHEGFRLDGVSDRASLSHKNSIALVPLEDLKKLTPSGQEEFSSLLNARVTDIRVDDGAPELTLEGVEPKELERFCDALEAHEQAEQAMGPTM